MDNKNYIRKIGSDIHSMSFIIGAGFSKNISDKYLSWGELLKDMIHEMYAKEMRSGYMNEWEIINKYGYLGIASEYIRRKGYHEAIDVYIEQRTPVLIDNEDGTYDMRLENNVVKNVDVSLHRTLLNMKVKNIYTFNYDNALDVYKDLTYTSERARKIKENDIEIKKIDEVFTRIEKLRNDFTTLQNRTSDKLDKTDSNLDLEKEFHEIMNTDIVLRVCGVQNDKERSIKEQTDDVYDALKSYKRQLLDSVKHWNTNKQDAYFVVKKSGDITIGEARRNIFKLHGSLRDLGGKKDEIAYGFDYDNHAQYIIAQEDYDSYNKKHEAFVDLMRISLLKDAYCIFGFSCDDPNFLLWINWVKDIVDKEAKENHDSENIWNKYFINVGDEDLDSDKRLLLDNHYIRIVDLYKAYPTAKSPNERLTAFFDDIAKMQSAKAIMKDFWVHLNFKTSLSSNEKNTIEYDEGKVAKAWNLMKDIDLAYFSTPFDHYRFYFLERIRKIIKDKDVNGDICKLFWMASDQDNLPMNVLIDDDNITNILDYVSSFGDETLKEKYKTLLDEGKILTNTWSVDCADRSDRSLLNHAIQCLFNFDLEQCHEIVTSWSPKGNYYRMVRLMILTSLNGGIKLDDLEGALVCESHEFNSDQEYLSTMELSLGLQEYCWGNSNMVAKFSKLHGQIEEVSLRNKDAIQLHDYFSRLQKELCKEEKIKPLGREGRSITFGSSDSVTLAAIRILQVLVKLGFVTKNMFGMWLTNENLYRIVEKIYAIYPYPCLYFASLCTNKDFSKRVAQLYCFSSSKEIQNVLPDILVKILKACHSKYLSEERKNVLYIYATVFIKRVHSKYWRKEFKTLFKNQDLDNRNEKSFWKSKYNFTQQAIAYMDDASFSIKIIDGILRKGEGISHYDNSLLIAAIKNTRTLNKEQIQLVYTLMNNTKNEAQVFVLFNLRNLVSKKRFYSWLENLDGTWLKYPSLILAVSQVAHQCKKFESLALSLLTESDYLWSTGIDEEDGHVVVSDTQTIDVDSFDRDVQIKGKAEIVAFERIKVELSLLEKARKSRFYEDWFQDWSTEVYSMKLFLVRHYKSLSTNEDIDALIRKCDDLYLNISGQRCPQEKLVQQESYKIEEGISELMKGVCTYGIKNFFLEYEIIANIILQHKTKALDMCIRHFSWAVAYKKYQKFFVSHNFQQIVLLILRVYKPYFIGKDIEEWDLNADKNVVEDSMINMNRWLKSFGLEDADWEKYKPIFYYKEL